MDIEEMTAFIQRYAEAKKLRIETGMWMHATEVRVRGVDQLPAFMEHCEHVAASATPFGNLLGLSVRYDETIPVGLVRIEMEDGSCRDFHLA